MKSHQSGWVSLPILMMTVVFGWLLLDHQAEVNLAFKHKTTDKYVDLDTHLSHVYSSIRTQSVLQVNENTCGGFCSPTRYSWRKINVASDEVWIQKIRISAWNVERWCATQNHQLASCWWHHDQGETRYANVQL